MRGALGMAMFYAVLAAETQQEVYRMQSGDDGSKGSNPLKPGDIDVTPKEKIIPPGCSKYYFDAYGNWYSSSTESRFEIVFETVALSSKTAYKKYSKWLENKNKAK